MRCGFCAKMLASALIRFGSYYPGVVASMLPASEREVD